MSATQCTQENIHLLTMAFKVLPPPDSSQSTQLFFSWMNLSIYSAYTLGLFPPQGLCTCHSTARDIAPSPLLFAWLDLLILQVSEKKKSFFFFSQKGLSFLTMLSKRSSLETLLYPISLPQSPLLFLLLFSHSVMSDSLQPHGLQHTRFPFRPLSSRVHSRSCPLSHWYYPTISSSVIPFSSCLQSSPALGSFSMNQLFTSGGHSIGVPPSASVLPMNIQGWFSFGLTDLISLLSKGLSRVFSSTTGQCHYDISSLSCLWLLIV